MNTDTQHPPVAVLCLNWNGAELLKECVDSLLAQTYTNLTIVVTDNGSTDNSLAVLSAYPTIHIVKLATNEGFDGGNNRGMEYIRQHIPCAYTILLNNDTKVAPDWAEQLVACAERHPEAGTVGSKVRFYAQPDHLHSTGIVMTRDMTTTNRGMYEKDTGQYDREEEIFGSIGCSVLVRMSALGEEALFEDRYFAYREDDELAWRMHFKGYKNIFCPTSVILHKHSYTTKPFSKFKLFHTERNRLWNLIQFMPLWYIPVSFWFTFTRYLSNTRSKSLHESMSKAGLSMSQTLITLIHAYGSALSQLPYFLKKRWTIQRTKKISSKDVLALLHTYGI